MAGTRSKITVLVEAVNEEAHLRECIRSARLLTDQIIVIDQGSLDNSVEVAEASGARVIQHEPVTFVEEIRKFGIEQVDTDWVFILDADERMTEELAELVSEVIEDGVAGVTYYKVPRQNMFGGNPKGEGAQWLKHGGWWPDEQLRLINTKAFKDWPPHIHSTPKIEGTMAILTQPIIHYFHGKITKMVEKTALFEDVESTLLFNAKRKSGTFIFMRKFLGELNRRLFKNAGFADGPIGIIESMYQAFSKTITYLMLYEKQKSRTI